jgi:RND family efflux transporter MFP subunit
MNRKLLVSGLALVMAFTIAGCGKSKEEPANTKVEATPVKVVNVTKGRVANAVTITGKVTAGLELAVVPKVPGKVAAVNVEVGQRVTKGQVMIRLDSSDVQAQLKSAQAGLAMQKALQAQAAIRYRDAMDNYERSKYLLDQGAISQVALEAAKMQYDTAAAGYNPAGGNTQTAAAINQAQANIDSLRVQLANLTITAPADGIIATRNVDPGEMASNQSPVVNIVNTDIMIIEGSLAESEVNLVAVGEQVKVFVKAVQETPYLGKVLSVSPSADARTKAFPVRIELENKDASLKSGMIAEVILDTKTKEGVLLIPKEAVLDRGDKKIAFVVKAKAALEKQVTLGLSDDTNVEVASGLSEGDQVVVNGQQLLTDQAPVSVQGEGEN